MHDPAGVRGREALGNLQRVVGRLAHGERAARQPLTQRFAFEKLHDREGDPALVSEIEDREDVGVGERRDRLGLPFEARERVSVGGEPGGQDLDGHLAREARVPRPVNLAHASRAERRKDLVGPETSPGGKNHGRPRILPDWRRAAGGNGRGRAPVS